MRTVFGHQLFDGQLELAWVYSTQRHARATIERVANGMITALRTLNELALHIPKL